MNKLFLLISLSILISSCTKKPPVDYKLFGPLLQNSFIRGNEEEAIRNTTHPVGFRKEIEIRSIPREAKLMIFADSRYLLWINGKYIERGPCRFDPKGPQYDLIDIKDRIRKGKNTIAVLVQGKFLQQCRPYLRPSIEALYRMITGMKQIDTSLNIGVSSGIHIRILCCLMNSINMTVIHWML